MFLDVKNFKNLAFRHFIVGLFSISLVCFSLLFYSSDDYFAVGKVARSFGNSAYVLLVITLILGPANRLYRLALVSWRRETGIWFFVLALSHFFTVFGYSRFWADIELPKMLGIIGLSFATVLAFTSSDKALSFLGSDSWKWLHSFVYVIFYAVTAHATYFLFWHFSEISRFAWLFIFLAVMVPILQTLAFIKTVVQKRRISSTNSSGQSA